MQLRLLSLLVLLPITLVASQAPLPAQLQLAKQYQPTIHPLAIAKLMATPVQERVRVAQRESGEESLAQEIQMRRLLESEGKKLEPAVHSVQIAREASYKWGILSLGIIPFTDGDKIKFVQVY